MIACFTAHPAVEKACDLLGIRLKKVAYDSKTFRINLTGLQQMITPNTIMMYGSAPNYPHGAIDNIKEMSNLAHRYQIGLHVDCCLGGFILPFAKRMGFSIPGKLIFQFRFLFTSLIVSFCVILFFVDFDFNLKGVTSMSLDTHKYGYALKGTSVVLYRTKELRHAQYFCYGDWPGGLYSTPNLMGSRSGGLIAQTWASMMTLGHQGYNRCTKGILETTKTIQTGLESIPEIEVLGETDAMILCFGTKKDSGLNIYMISEEMRKKGWLMNPIQHPAALHFCITYPNVGHEKKYINDLKDVIEELKNSPNKEQNGFAVIYGTTAALPAGPINELLKVYNDVVLKI
jgi:sphinganine-1-phosphate aldolase